VQKEVKIKVEVEIEIEVEVEGKKYIPTLFVSC
jgi:hypothetical protein